MTVEEILAAMQAVIDEATDSADPAAEPALTDEQASRYEALEGQLKRAQKSAEIQKRNAAYNSVKPVVSHTTANTDNTLDRAFSDYLRTGHVNSDMTQLRAQAEGTGSAGGFLVPDTFRNKLVERMKAFGGIANVVETYTTGDGSPVNWPTIDDTANVGEIVAEGGTFASGADMTFGEANLGAYKYMAGGGSNLPLRVSVELLQDAAFDVEGLISRKLGERIARIQATHLVSGTGVAQPLGIKTGLTGVQSVGATITYADLVTYIHSVDPEYRKSARWAFNDASLAIIRKLVDGDNRPLIQPAGSGLEGSPGGDSLLGYPVTIDQAFPTFAANTTTNWGVFGDLTEGYVVRRVKDVQIVVDPYGRAANGQVQFTAWARMDATQQNTNAYVALTGHA